jgi:hypothetical protein
MIDVSFLIPIFAVLGIAIGLVAYATKSTDPTLKKTTIIVLAILVCGLMLPIGLNMAPGYSTWTPTAKRIPFGNTNGTMTDSSTLTYDVITHTLHVPNIATTGSINMGAGSLTTSGKITAGNASLSQLYVNGEKYDPTSEASAIVWVDTGAYYNKNGATGKVSATGNPDFSVYLLYLQSTLHYKSITLKDGVYNCATSINIWPSVQVTGSGIYTILNFTTLGNHPLGTMEINSTLRNLRITGKINPLPSDMVQKLNAGENTVIEDISMDHVGYGINIETVENVVVNRVHLSYIQDAADHAAGIHVGSTARNIHVSNFEISESDRGVEMDAGPANVYVDHGRITNIHNFASTGNEPFALDCHSHTGEGGIDNINFDYIYLKNCRGFDAQCTGSGLAADMPRNINFSHITQDNATLTLGPIIEGFNITVRDCSIINSDTTGLFVSQNIKHAVIDNLKMDSTHPAQRFILTYQTVEDLTITHCQSPLSLIEVATGANDVLIADNAIPSVIIASTATNVVTRGNTGFVSSGDVNDRWEDGLRGYWPIEDITTSQIIDVSRYNNKGTLNGATSITTGKIGNTLTFVPAQYNRIPCGSSASLETGTDTHMTIMAWVNLAASTPQDVAGRTVGGRTFDFYVGSDNKVHFLWSSDGTAPNADNLGTTATISGWTHLAVTFNSGVVKIYINGVQAATVSSAITSIYTPSGCGFRIGDSGYNGQYADGKIDEVYLYNRVLTPQEIMGQYLQTQLRPDTIAIVDSKIV